MTSIVLLYYTIFTAIFIVINSFIKESTNESLVNMRKLRYIIYIIANINILINVIGFYLINKYNVDFLITFNLIALYYLISSYATLIIIVLKYKRIKIVELYAKINLLVSFIIFCTLIYITNTCVHSN